MVAYYHDSSFQVHCTQRPPSKAPKEVCRVCVIQHLIQTRSWLQSDPLSTVNKEVLGLLCKKPAFKCMHSTSYIRETSQISKYFFFNCRYDRITFVFVWGERERLQAIQTEIFSNPPSKLLWYFFVPSGRVWHLPILVIISCLKRACILVDQLLKSKGWDSWYHGPFWIR